MPGVLTWKFMIPANPQNLYSSPHFFSFDYEAEHQQSLLHAVKNSETSILQINEDMTEPVET